MAGRTEDGDLVLYSRMTEEYSADDVVLYEYDGKIYTSSILAFPGDLIEIDEQGYLYLNHIRVSDSVAFNLDQGETPNFSSPYRVPSGSYFVLNNNLESMEDSRVFGSIYTNNIKGKVISILRTRAI